MYSSDWHKNKRYTPNHYHRHFKSQDPHHDLQGMNQSSERSQSRTQYPKPRIENSRTYNRNSENQTRHYNNQYRNQNTGSHWVKFSIQFNSNFTETATFKAVQMKYKPAISNLIIIITEIN